MLKFHDFNDKKIAELIDKNYLISETQDALDVMGDATYQESYRLIIRSENFHDDFFNLKTRLAGEILQKFSTYNCKLAIVGDFSIFKSKSLEAFIRESNRGNRIFFVNTINDAIEKLSKS